MVQQSLSQIRTVAAYNGEEAAAKAYDAKLDTPQKVRCCVAGCWACPIRLAKRLGIQVVQVCLLNCGRACGFRWGPGMQGMSCHFH